MISSNIGNLQNAIKTLKSDSQAIRVQLKDIWISKETSNLINSAFDSKPVEIDVTTESDFALDRAWHPDVAKILVNSSVISFVSPSVSDSDLAVRLIRDLVTDRKVRTLSSATDDSNYITFDLRTDTVILIVDTLHSSDSILDVDEIVTVDLV